MSRRPTRPRFGSLLSWRVLAWLWLRQVLPIRDAQLRLCSAAASSGGSAKVSCSSSPPPCLPCPCRQLWGRLLNSFPVGFVSPLCEQLYEQDSWCQVRNGLLVAGGRRWCGCEEQLQLWTRGAQVECWVSEEDLDCLLHRAALRCLPPKPWRGEAGTTSWGYLQRVMCAETSACAVWAFWYVSKLSLGGCQGRAKLTLSDSGCRLKAHGELLLQSRCVVNCSRARSLREAETVALGALWKCYATPSKCCSYIKKSWDMNLLR